jgi:hypothetical protein
MKPITTILFFPSKFDFKSCQYVIIKKPVDVIAEYKIKIHYNPVMGIEHIKAVIIKLENEYAYIPNTYKANI